AWPRSQTILRPPTAWPLFKRSSVAAFERSVTSTERRQHGGIRVERERDLRMPEDFLHDLRVNALCEQQRGARMSEVVDSHLRGVRSNQQLREGTSHVTVIERRSDCGRKHEIRISCGCPKTMITYRFLKTGPLPGHLREP